MLYVFKEKYHEDASMKCSHSYAEALEKIAQKINQCCSSFQIIDVHEALSEVSVLVDATFKGTKPLEEAFK